MPYNLSVHVERDGAPRRELYHESLGADTVVFDYWHLPACQLGLPLLAQIYFEGLVVDREQLDEFSSELEKLRQYWQRTGAGTTQQIPHTIKGNGGGPSIIYVWLSDYLCERAGFARKAIGLARESAGVIEIS